MAWLETLLIRVSWRDFFCSSAKSLAFSMAMAASPASTREKLHVAIVERLFLWAVHRHHAHGAIVKNQGHGAHGAHGLAKPRSRGAAIPARELLAHQQRLARAHDILDHVVPGRARALRKPLAIPHFNFETNLVGLRVVEGDEKAGDVQDAAHFRIDALEQRIEVEGRAERAADFVEDVQLFAAARGLLDQVAVLDRRADLLAEREQQAAARRA